MNFKYVDFSENLKNYIVDSEDTIYIFESNSAKKTYMPQRAMDIFAKNSFYLTMSEFREKLFVTDRFVLKEEKRTLLFYEALSEKIKKAHNIKSYYDIIDYGENFLSFYRELREYRVEDLKKLEPWQKERYDELEEIKNSYENLLDKYYYITPDRVFSMENMNDRIFRAYSKIVFVNIINFTPFEREFIKKLEKTYEIDIFLQMLKGDFDEEKMTFVELSLPEKLDREVEVVEVSEENLQFIDFYSKIDEESYLLSCNFDHITYDKLLNKNLIKKNEDVFLSETNLFKFINIIHEVLAEKVQNVSYSLYKTSTFLGAFESILFRDYFSFSSIDYDIFMSCIVDENIKYINPKEMEKTFGEERAEFLEKFNKVVDFLEKLSACETIKALVEFLGNMEEFDYTYFDQEKYKDLIPKYFEVLSEMQSIEMLQYKPLWNSYFENINSSLLMLLLKYMRHKRCSEIFESRYKISHYDNFAQVDKNIFILDTNNMTLPGREGQSFLLSDNQKKENGLFCFDKDKEIKRYNFFRNIFLNKKTVIYSIKNEDKNIDASTFVDELVNTYKVEVVKSFYERGNFSSFVLSVLEGEEGEVVKLSEDKLYKDNKSLTVNESSFVLSSYAFEGLLSCPYRFYLEYILRLNKHNREVKYKMDSRIIGIVVHEVLERLGNEKRKEILKGDYFVSQDRIKAILKSVLRDKQDYIPKNYENYYEKVMFPIFIRGMEVFYEKLYAKVGEINLTSFSQEKSKREKLFSKGDIDVELSGRGDLVLEGEGVRALFDYKTGGGSFNQLYFYSILYYGDESAAEKYIYNVWESELLEDDKKNVITKEDMIDSISAFLGEEIFRRTEKKENCRNCIYKDICRMRWECE